MNHGPATSRPALPAGVWVLGFVSLLMDVSSEMIHSLLPLFMATTLGASALAIGLVEGLGEATALVVKVFSGTLSDYLGSFFTRFHALRTLDTTELHRAETPFAASSAITPKPDGTYTVSHTGATYVVDEAGTVIVEWPFGTAASVMSSDLLYLLRRMG